VEPDGQYELKIDTNGDFVETSRSAPLPIGADGTQHVQSSSSPAPRPVTAARRARSSRRPTRRGEVTGCHHGIKLFTGQRYDPFYNFIPFPSRQQRRWRPALSRLRRTSPAHNDFANTSVRSVVLEVPSSSPATAGALLGTTAYFDTGTTPGSRSNAPPSPT